MQQTQFTQSIVLPQLATKYYRAAPSNIKAAMYWYQYGFSILPIIPGTKFPAIKWDPWLAALSKQTIIAYWQQNPAYELGFIVGDNFIVFDADSTESIAALVEIELAFDITPNLVVKTSKGEHHYFKLAAGSVAKSDSHCTKLYPERIDIKTGRAIVILPPSTGKFIAFNEAESALELTEVSQKFIDAVYRHNGRNTQIFTSKSSPNVCNLVNAEKNYLGLKALLKLIDSDLGYDDWLRVLAAIFNHTKGTEYGLEIATIWSSKGKKYKGEKEIEAKWRSFSLDHPNPLRIGFIMKLVENGHAIFTAAEEPFEIIADVTAGGAQ